MTYRPGKRSAARNVWPPPLVLKRTQPAWVHASIRASVAGAVALLMRLLERDVMAGVITLIALSTVLLAFFAPGLYAKLQRALDALSQVVGRVLAYVVLTPMYFLVITPMGLLRGEARRRFQRSEGSSMWKRRVGASRIDRPY